MKGLVFLEKKGFQSIQNVNLLKYPNSSGFPSSYRYFLPPYTCEAYPALRLLRRRQISCLSPKEVPSFPTLLCRVGKRSTSLLPYEVRAWHVPPLLCRKALQSRVRGQEIGTPRGVGVLLRTGSRHFPTS